MSLQFVKASTSDALTLNGMSEHMHFILSLGIQKQDGITSLFIILRNMSERGKYGIN